MAMIELYVSDQVLENLQLKATDKGFLLEDYLISLWSLSVELTDLVTSRQGSMARIGEADLLHSDRPQLKLIKGGKQF